ncbi:MAG: hypothetical protein NC548_52650 [Lachnospiraceae bacterium]|nr:hypothetical protein [Bacteroides sp.]MCM1223133.1 hypothetical protein [Lachnospiraceae bacterium]MCM1441838.1 hypothetical protein [Roseburia sp.]
MKTLEQIEMIPQNGIIVRQEGAVLRVFFDIAKAPTPESPKDGEEVHTQPDDLCECYNVDVQAPITYGSIVAAIVNDKYSSDDVQALQANYLEAKDSKSSLDSDKRKEYLAEWSDFQAWRTTAKEIATSVVSMINK